MATTRKRPRKPRNSVVALFDGEIVPPAADPEIVERLENLLAMAKSGHLVGIAYATAVRNGFAGSGWYAQAQYGHHLDSGVGSLFHRIFARE